MKQNIVNRFKEEFYPIEDKFNVIKLTITEAYESKDIIVARPGVYVFWFEEKIIKVGRHLVNSRKRALEHISDNTKNEEFQMKSFDGSNTNCGLVLINCKKQEDYHWVAAIEIFLEDKLEPVIKSKRTG